ncbi:MAG: WYL domain-containing protein [Lachnospiraceae bacterium]|nr:MAG: WYL domain-containing protein [Lachnospiraceae bacterium]
MPYKELIKNFDNIRMYMRDFFVYGFRTREDYAKKGLRSYDNEKRRIQNYLGDLLSFKQTESGKKVFISLDAKSVSRNPLYKAFKVKSFTSKDISLYFIVMDILKSGESYSLTDILNKIDSDYLSYFSKPLLFDESTLRKKLKEYEALGLIKSEKTSKKLEYSLVNDDIEAKDYKDVIRFFTEENILGVIGSYIEDKFENSDEYLSFKNRYIMNAYDTEVVFEILRAIKNENKVKIQTFASAKQREYIPLKLYVSKQGGRNYLMCKGMEDNRFYSIRTDYIKSVSQSLKANDFSIVKIRFEDISRHIWGVSYSAGKLEHFEMDIYVGKGEEYIVSRLEREKRCGKVTKLDEETYRFSVDLYDSYELVPWIRTFFGRIKRLKCSNRMVSDQIKFDIVKMSKQYGEENGF